MGEKDVRREPWKNLGDKISKRLWFLDSESLCAKAKRHTGLEDFGDPPLEVPLEVLVNSLEHEADLHPVGRFLMRVRLQSLLETRLRLVNDWSAKSQRFTELPIRRPVFITGMPRSGSSFLHELLAE